MYWNSQGEFNHWPLLSQINFVSVQSLLLCQIYSYVNTES